MAVTLTDGSAGLFDVFGRMFQAMASMQTSAGTTVRTDCLDILTQFENVDDSLALNAIIADVTTVADTFDSGAQSAMQSLKTIAQGYLLTVFHEDAPFANPSVDNALLRLIAQMEADSDSVDASTVSIAVAAGGSNVGNAVLVATVKRGDGLDQMHVLAEVLTATALTDEGATLSLSDGESVGVTSVRWPQGSGASQSLRAVTPRDGLIREGSFDVLSTVDSDLPAGWLVTTGTPGTTLYMTTPEQQTITLGNTPSGGYYSLRWTNAAGDVQETAQLTYNATAGQVQSALRRLTGLESVTVTSSGTTPNLTHTVTFLGIGGNVAQVSSVNNTTGTNSTNEVQTITISDADGGTFTLTFDGQTTSGIAYNATAATVDAALEALSSIEVGEVSVSGSAGGPYTVTFTNSLGASDQPLMTASAASLTHTSPGVSIVQTTAGSSITNEVQTVNLVDADGGTFTLTFGGQTTAAIAHNASAATVDAALEALSSIGTGNIAVTGSSGGPYTCTFGGALAGQNLALMTYTSSLTSTTEFVAAAETTAGDTGVSVDGLYELWDMNETSGTARVGEVRAVSLVEDISAVLSETGKNGNAANLASGYILKSGAGTLGTVTSGNDATLTAWVKPSAHDDEVFFEVANSSVSAYLRVAQTSSGGESKANAEVVMFNGSSGVATSRLSTASLTLDSWNLISARINESQVSVSINGGSYESTSRTPSGTLFGSTPYAQISTIEFTTKDVSVDECAIWDVALSDAQIAELWASGAGSFYPYAGSGTAEVQTLTATGTLVQGTFDLTYGGQTVAVPWNATAAAMQTALRTITGLSAVTCSGGPINSAPVTVTFPSALGDVALLTVSNGNLYINTVETTAGDTGTNEVQTVTLTNTPTGGTFTLTYDLQETSAIAWNASASTVETALEALSTIDSCSVSGSAGGPWAVTFQGSLAATNVDLMDGDGSNLLTNASPSISVVETAKGSAGSGTIVHATTIPGTPQVYAGSYALVLESDGSEQTTLHYRLGTLEAETNYALNAFLTAAAGIASGTLTIDLLDGIDGTVLTDEQGANQTLTVTLTDLTTSWQSLDDLMTEVILRTPRKLPPFVYLRIRWGTVPPDGATVFLDELTMVSMTELYAGGPFVAMFAGNTALRIDDVYTLTVANNRAGTLHEWMNRTFDLADKRLLLPVDAAGSETIPDSLIQ
jgi:hypothetical protein